jgi:hypothetical protein
VKLPVHPRGFWHNNFGDRVITFIPHNNEKLKFLKENNGGTLLSSLRCIKKDILTNGAQSGDKHLTFVPYEFT